MLTPQETSSWTSFYAVRVGRQVGIYSTWDECKKQTDGFKGAKYKKFQTLDEANSFMRGEETPQKKAVQVASQAVIPSSESTAAWTDFYAVRKGHQPGIYSTWAECKQQIDGFKDAKFKKFQTLDAAKAFLKGESNDSVEPKRPGGNVIKRATSSPAVARLGNEIRIYTDGSCPDNVGSAGKKGRAGWGIVVVPPSSQDGNDAGTKVMDFYGPVLYSNHDLLFLGATCGTNNTGELSAIGMAMKWLEEADPTDRPCGVLFDSKYAANIAQGHWKAKENVELSENVQSCRKKVSAVRRVVFEHVKGHSGDTFNERADRNANLGAAGATKMWVRGDKPLIEVPGKIQNLHAFKKAFSAGAKRNADESPMVISEMGGGKRTKILAADVGA